MTPPKAERGESRREIRHMVGPEGLTLRADPDGGGSEWPLIVGRAIVYDRWTVLWEDRFERYEEVIRPGAVRAALADPATDPAALWNHESGDPFARYSAPDGPGSLRLIDGPEGLDYIADPIRTNRVREKVVEPIRARVVKGSSFAFRLREGGDEPAERIRPHKEDGFTIWRREVLSIDLFDVSPVTYPAYQDATVALRHLDAARREWSAADERRRQEQRARARVFDLARAESELAGFPIP